MKIYLTAIIKAKPAFKEEVLEFLQHMVTETRQEEACILYDLHVDLEDENSFIFYEIWKDMAGLVLHNQQPYIKNFGTFAADKLLEEPKIYKARRI